MTDRHSTEIAPGFTGLSAYLDLLILDSQVTEQTAIWKIADYPHTVAGSRRGFEVRVYRNPE
jgi:hypothetical protein